MKRTLIIFTALSTVLMGSILWAQLSAPPRKILTNRNNYVVSEIFEPTAQIRGLQTSRIGQGGTTPLSIANQLKGAGITISNVDYTGHNLAGGTFSGGGSAGFGFDTGIMLSSGAISNAIGPNNSASKSANFGQPGDADLDLLAGDETFDAAILEFDFVPQYNKIALEYLLASEEYPEMIDYADVMAIFVNGVNIALLPGTATPVSIGNVNHLVNSQYYVDNLPTNNNYSAPYTAPYDTQADGFTVPLTAIADVVPGVTHHIKIAIADLGDNVYDSWLLMRENSFHSASDLSIYMDYPANPVPGSLGIYRLRAYNRGIINAQNVAVDFRLPLGSELQSLPTGVADLGGYYRWEFTSLASGDSSSIDLTALLQLSPPGIGVAQISSSILDNNEADNRNVAYIPPQAVTDSYFVAEDNMLSVGSYQGLLVNDLVYSVTAPAVSVNVPPQHGDLTLGPDGSFSYTPQQDYHGTDSFTYRIYDGQTYSDNGLVEITVTAVNDPPVLNFPPSFTTDEDTPLSIDITQYASDVDGDLLTVVNVFQWIQGSWSFASPHLTLSPNHNWFGTGSLSLVVSDGVSEVGSNLMTVYVDSVADISTSPASLDFGNISQGSSSTLRLFIHNSDSQPAHLIPPVLSSSDPAFSFTAPSSLLVPSGGSVYTDVTFIPVEGLVYSGVLSVFNDVFGESPYPVNLGGSGLSLPEIGVTPAQIAASHPSGGSFEHTLTISNTGQSNLNWTAGLLPGVPAWMSLSPGSGTTPPSGTSQLVMQLDLSQVPAGEYTASIQINSNAANDPQINIPVSITVSGTAQILVTPAQIDFGQVYTGIIHTGQLQVLNTGASALLISSAATPSQLSVFPAQLTIPPFGSGSFDVNLLSLEEDTFSGTVTLNSNDPSSPQVLIPITATLTKPPILTLNTYSITGFGISEQMVSAQLQLSNSGSETLTWQGSLQDSGDGYDWVSFTPESGSILPGAQQTLMLSFNPAFLSPGMRTAILLLGSNDIFTPTQAVNLTYIKQDFYYTAYDNNNNADQDFPDNDMGVVITYNSPLNPIEFNIYSNLPSVSTARLVVRAYDVDDQNGELSQVFLNGHNLGILRGGSGAFSNTIFNVNPTFVNPMGKNLISIEVDTQEAGNGISVNSGQLVLNNLVLDAQIRYVQSDKSSYIASETATLTIEVDTQLSSQAVMTETQLLNSSGQVLISQTRSFTVNAFENDAVVESLELPSLLASGDYEFAVAVYDQSSGLQQDLMSIAIAILPNQPRLELNTTILDYGILPSGVSRSLPLTIYNSGNEQLLISSLSGGSPGISALPATATILPFQSQEFTVTLQSNQLGTYNNVLLIQSNDPALPVAGVAILAELIPNQAYISTTPDALDFGQCFINTQSQLQLEISNLGPLDLAVSSIDVADPAFVVSETSFNLAYGQSLTLQIDFEPTAPGEYDTNLQITSNAGNEPVYLIPVSASAALPPQISVNPLQITAGAESGDSALSTLEVSNTGGSDLRWSLQENLGQAAQFDGYSVTSAQYATIPNRSAIQLAGGEFTVSVWFKVESNLGGSASGGSQNGGKQYIVSKSINTRNGFFGIYTDGSDTATTNKNLALVLRNSQGIREIKVNDIINLNEWYQVAAVFNNGVVNFYLDGNLIGSTTASGFNGNTDNWVLAKYTTDATRFYRFQGSLDEFRIFNVAQSQAYLLQTRHNLLTNQEPHLTGYWNFDEGNLHDATLANNHGTAFGAVQYPASGINSVPTWVQSTPGFGAEAAGSGQVVQIHLDASELLAGSYPANLNLSSNDNSNPLITIPIVFAVSGEATALLDPSALDYGSVIIATTKNLSLDIANNGTDSLQLSGFSFSDPAFACGTTQLNIPAGESRSLIISFTPDQVQPYAGTLSLTTNIASQPQIMVELSGEGALPPVMAYTPSSFNVDLDYGNTAQRTLQISNQQGLPLEFELSLDETNRGNASGIYLNLDHDCKGMTWLNGKLYYVTYQDHLLKRYDPATQSVEASWQIHNAPYGITTDGSTFFIGSPNGRIYRYNSAGTQLSNFQNPLVTFTPTLSYADNSLYVANVNNSSSTVYKLSLTGTLLGQYSSNLSRSSQFIHVPEHQSFYALQASHQRLVRFGIVSGSVAPLDTLAIPMGAAYALAHNGRDLYLLENNKNYMTRHDDGISEFNWIQLSSDSGSISAGSSANIALEFSGLNTFAGIYQADLNISSNDPLQPLVSLPLQLAIQGVPQIALLQQELDFGTAYLGYPLSLILQVENNGSAELILSGITVPPPFAADQAEITIPPWQTQDLVVQYNPVALGLHSGVLSFSTNDPLSPQLQIPVSGECLEAPNITIDPSFISSNLMNDAQQEIPLSITNNGLTPLSYKVTLTQSLSPGGRGSQDGTPPENTGRLLGDLLGEYPLFLQNAGALALDGYLYVVNTSTDQLVKCALPDASVIESYPIHDQPYGICWDGVGFWIGNQGGILYRYDPTSLATDALNQPLSFIATNLGSFPAFTFDGSHLIVANALSSTQPATFRKYTLQGMLLSEYYSQKYNIAQLCHIPQYGAGNIWAYQNVITNQVPAGGNILQFRLSGNQATVIRSKACWDDAYTYTIAHDGRDFLISDFDGPLQRYDDGHWLGTTSYAGELTGNSNAVVPVMLNPAGIIGGDYSGTIQISSNDPDSPQLVLPVSLQVQGYPAISISPSTAVYDSTLIGEFSQKSFIVSNPGTDILTVAGITSSNPAFIPGVTEFTLAPSGSRTIQITFQPIAAGWQEAIISVASNASSMPLAEIGVSGFAKTPVPGIAVTPNPFSYPPTYTNSASAKVFTLTNNGTAALIVNGYDSSSGMFSTARSFPFSVARNDSTTFSVVFTPAAAVSYQESFVLHTNAVTADYVISLSGDGLAPYPDITAVPAQLNYGNMVTGIPLQQNLTVINTGQLALEVSSVNSPYPGMEFSETSFNLVPGQQKTLALTLTAQNAGVISSEVLIASNDPDTPLLTVPFGANAVNGIPSIGVDPASLSFGVVEIGSSLSKTLRISNTGNVPLIVSSLQSSNPVFGTQVPSLTIDPGSYQDLSVTYTPQSPAVETGVLLILNNSPVNPNLQVSLSGTGRHPVIYGVYPPVIDVYTNQAQVLNEIITITNNGLSTMEYELSAPGDPTWLSFSPSAGIITPSNSAVIDLSLDPTGLNYDLYEAILLLTANSSQQPQTQIPIYLNYSNYNITTHDNEDNYGNGLADNDMDILLTSADPIAPVEFNIFTDAATIDNAQLKLTTQGVINGEVSKVYFNNQYIGNLAAAPNPMQDSYFTLNQDWIVLGTTEKNTVRVSLDETNADPAGTMVMLGKLDYNRPFSNASIVSLTASPEIITPVSLLTINQELVTNLFTQSVRIESRLYDASDQMVLDQNTRVLTLSAYQHATTTATWNLSGLIPAGDYHVSVEVYDNLSNQLQTSGRLDLVIRENRPIISVDPATVNFGMLYPGFARTDTLTISNLGAAVLEISNLHFSNIQYSALENTLSIPAGGSYGLEITALLTQLGNVDAQLTITSNDPDQQTLNVNLLAQGIPAPQIQASLAEVNLVMEQYASITSNLQISNAGGSELQIGSVQISGAGWISVQIANTALAPDTSTDITLTLNSYGLPYGLYWADLIIESNDPATPQLVIPIEVDVTMINVVAQFTAVPLSGLAPLPVQFTSEAFTTDGSSIIAWSWDFDDDGTPDSELEHPSHVYTNPGSYSVRLTVTSDGRATHSLLRSDYIFVTNNAPVVADTIPDFTLTEDIPLLGFDLSPYFSDPDGDPLTYAVSPNPYLSFVLNGSLLDIIPQQDYNGSETIVISASDPATATASQAVWVNVLAANDPPQFIDLPPSFTYLRWTEYVVDLSQYFTDPDTDPQLVTVAVTGSVNTTCTINQHILTFGSLGDWYGNELIQITIDDNVRRVTATATVELQVLEEMVVDFSADATDILAGLPVNFTSTIQGNPNVYEWDFENDGVFDSDLPNPTFVYNIGGLKTVRLNVMYVTPAGDTLHQGSLIRPDYILVRGTMIPGGEALGSWVLEGSPYNITGPINIPELSTLVINPNVQVNVLYDDVFIKVEGTLSANQTDFRSLDPDGWVGIEIDDSAINTTISSSAIHNAELPLWIKANALIQNCVIEKDSLLTFPGEWAVQLSGDISPVIDGLQISDYFNGIQVESGTGGAQPVISNIRVRNTTNSLRTDSYGMKLEGRVMPAFDNVIIEDFQIGLMYNGNNLPLANQPVISNIRVRNTTNSLRSPRTGIWLKNLLRVIVTQDSISDCVIGLHIENEHPGLANQPVISNIRVRNTTNSLRTETWGIKMLGHIIPRIYDVDIDDYIHGISLIGVNAPYHNTQPVISNIRVRNTTNSLRPVGIGIYVQDITRISVVNDSLFGYQEGLKFFNSQPQLANQPVISNIRVRNSTNALRNTGTGIYSSPNVNMSVTGCLIQGFGVGVHSLQNASQINDNMFIDNDNAALIQGILPGYDLSYNDMALTPSYYISTGAAIKTDNVSELNLHNNTIVGYPGLLWAQSSNLTFQQNIGWGAQPLATPFVSTASSIETIYNDIYYSGGVYPGTGNISADPLFADPAQLDFNLTYDSPCIDTGNPAMPMDPDNTRADMGAHIYEHYSAFSSDLRFVLPNTAIQFTNQSMGHPPAESQYYWDFNDDRTADSTLENPVWTFTDLGRYNISLRIVSGNLADTLVLENFILVQNALLPPPQNVQLQVVENTDVRLTWEPVTHDIAGNPITPTYYLVYSYPQPSGQFRFQGMTPNICEYTHFQGAVKDQMYYVVIGFVGSRAQLEEFLLRKTYLEIRPEGFPTPSLPDPRTQGGFGPNPGN